MAHISTISSGIFSYLDVYTGDVSSLNADSNAAAFEALFAAGTPGSSIRRIPSVREFPAIGNAASVTNVPVFGQQQSAQVAGQADAPTMDVTVNWVGTEMAPIEALKGQEVAFRFMIANQAVTEADGASATLAVENSEFYWVGRIEAVQITPSLTDANTAVINITIQQDFVGPATLDAA